MEEYDDRQRHPVPASQRIGANSGNHYLLLPPGAYVGEGIRREREQVYPEIYPQKQRYLAVFKKIHQEVRSESEPADHECIEVSPAAGTPCTVPETKKALMRFEEIIKVEVVGLRASGALTKRSSLYNLSNYQSRFLFYAGQV